MFDIRGADAEANRAECAISGGVAVARGNDKARQDPAQIREHDMFDPLARMQDIEHLDAKIAAVPGKIGDLLLRLRIGAVAASRRIRGIHMIDNAQCRLWTPQRAPGLAQAAERLRTGVFIEDRAIDIEQQRFARALHIVDRCNPVSIHDLVVQGSRGRHAMASRAFMRTGLHCRCQPRPMPGIYQTMRKTG